MVNPSFANQDVVAEMVTRQDLDSVHLSHAGSLLEMLGSETRRSILAVLDTQPMNKASIADCVDISIQNASYHLDQLNDAGLVRVIGTHYSKRGQEMDIFAPAFSSILIQVSDDNLDSRALQTHNEAEKGGKVDRRYQGIPLPE